MMMMTISKHGTRKLKRGYPKTKTGVSHGSRKGKKRNGEQGDRQRERRDGKRG
jgi:hypothetical protein